MKKFISLNNTYSNEEVEINQFEIGIVEKEETDFFEIQFISQPKTISIGRNFVTIFNPLETGDGFNNKVCNRCYRLLPIENFEKNQNGKNNRTIRRPSCNDCRELIDGINIPLNVKKQWETTKPHFEIWECPICKKKTIPGLTSKVVLDHNHKTGIPNAWICDSCNTGLGRFNDDTDVLTRAIQYLNNTNSNNE